MHNIDLSKYIDLSVALYSSFIHFLSFSGLYKLWIKFNREGCLFPLLSYCEQALCSFVYFYFHKVSQKSYKMDSFIPVLQMKLYIGHMHAHAQSKHCVDQPEHWPPFLTSGPGVWLWRNALLLEERGIGRKPENGLGCLEGNPLHYQNWSYQTPYLPVLALALPFPYESLLSSSLPSKAVILTSPLIRAILAPNCMCVGSLLTSLPAFGLFLVVVYFVHCAQLNPARKSNPWIFRNPVAYQHGPDLHYGLY